MSENLINTQIDGTVIQAAHVNQYKTALVEDVLPRNLSGQNEDEAGSLGSDLYRWLKGIFSTLFANKFSVGAVGNETNNPFISQATDNLNFKVITGKGFNFYINNVLSYFNNASYHDFYIGGVLKGQITANGIDGQYLKALSVSNASVNADAVTESKIANSAVTENKISNSAVTTNKLGTSAVTNDKITDSTISLSKHIVRSLTTANFDTVNNNYYVDSSSEAPTANGYANGVAVTINYSRPSVIAWYVTSTNANHRCGITSQPDSAIQAGCEGGIIVANATNTITARVYNIDTGATQTGTVTLKVLVLS